MQCNENDVACFSANIQFFHLYLQFTRVCNIYYLNMLVILMYLLLIHLHFSKGIALSV